MTYFECAECGHLADLVGVERREFVDECPVCETATRWSLAFEGEGVSF